MIYFLIYLLLEVLVSVEIASRIGGLGTFLEIVLSAVIGGFIIANFRYSVAGTMRELMDGTISQEEFVASNMSRFLGAVLLVVPGFLTDIIGVLLQFSSFGYILLKPFRKKDMQKHRGSGGAQNDDIIDVDVIERKD